MKLLIDSTDHFKFMNECVADQPATIRLASYGLYAGILPDGRDVTEWGDKYKSQTRDLMEAMRVVKDVRVLIGLYEYKSCKGKQTCIDCERKYVLDLIRLLNHAEVFSNFKWRVSSQSHVKCVLFSYPDDHLKGVAGGRNFTDSSWADITIELDKMSVLRLEEHFDHIWGESQPLTSHRINTIMHDMGISEKTIESILAST